MRLTLHLLSVGVLLGLSASVVAKPALVLTTVNLRAAPGTTNEIVAKIPGGSLVDAASCTDGWCAVTWQEKSGFAIQTALDLSGRVPARQAGPALGPPRAYRALPPGYVVEGPPVYYESPPVYYVNPYWRYRYGRYW
jgi:hypothetical protein